MTRRKGEAAPDKDPKAVQHGREGAKRKSKVSVITAGGAEVKKVPRQFKMGDGDVCGAKRKYGRGNGVCQLAAGWGTNHPGWGRCKFHSGSTPNGIKAAAKLEAVRVLGAPKEINPLDALLWCIRVTAGEVEYLTNRIADYAKEEDAIDTSELFGKQWSLLVRTRHDAVDRLARYSEMAIKANIADRAVKLAEGYGMMLARLIRGILTDLMLTAEQTERAPSIVRYWLVQVQQPDVTEQTLEIPATTPTTEGAATA